MSDPGKGASYREVTISALLFAAVIGIVMNAAITYAGLKIGFTIGGSAIAAVLGFGVLRGLLRKGTILETNVAQTAASAINTSNSGIIFTVPVLFLIGLPLTASSTEFWLITLAAMGGAVLGAAFIIPLRKQMIEIDRLRFPSGTGVAAILKSPGAGAAKSIVLVAGIVISALIYLPVALPGIKNPAPVGELQQLFEDEKISWADVQRTQDIHAWITAQEAPEQVVARGVIAAELEGVRKQIASMEDCDRRRELRVQEEAIQKRLSDPEAEFDTLYSDTLCLAAYRAEQGERTWASLKSLELGWAAKPLWGYSDLGWRFGAKPAPGPMTDLNGDGTPDQPLDRRVDYDNNGRPDLVLDDEFFRFGRLIGLPDEMELIFAIAPFALGAGFITGRAGLLVLAGGILAYLFLTPVAFNQDWFPLSVQPHEAPSYAFQAFNRPLGIGLLLGGALMGVAMSVPAIRAAIKSMIAAGKTKVGGSDEMGIKSVVVAIIGAFILFFIAADYVGNRPFNRVCPVVTGVEVCQTAPTAQYEGYTIAFSSAEAAETWKGWTQEKKDAFLKDRNARPGWLSGLSPHLRAAVIALIAGVWIWFAGIIIAQCTGMTDWSPISGMALLTVVLVMLLAGTGAVVGAVLIGAALCVAITLAADMMADLRTGHLVGASPKRQQIVELCVVAVGPLIAMLVVLVIAEANRKSFGVPLGPGTPTAAPQAQALQAVITGVQGGEMPYALYGFGALLGGLLGLGAFSGLGVLVGLSMYLPFYYIATYGVGCLINMGLAKIKGRRWAEEWGVPFAAGLIVGESILALIINMYVLATG